MSYSLREPQEERACECRYDEANDRMDSDDCAFHTKEGDAESIPTATSILNHSPEVEHKTDGPNE